MSVNVGQRNVPDTPQNRQLEAGIKARDLAIHTIKICNNKNIFLPEYQSALTDDIIRTAKDIYKNVKAANDIRVKKEDPETWEERNRLQKMAVRNCRDLISCISLAKPLFHLKGRKVKYWRDLTIETKEKIMKWHESDVKRYE